MIFKVNFEDRHDYAQAKNQLDLLQSYHTEYDELMDICDVIEISDDEAKTIMLSNSEYNEDEPDSDENCKEFSLFDSVVGDDFSVVGSTEWT